MSTFEQHERNDTRAGAGLRPDLVDALPGVPPRVLADRYEVLEEIGSGATAITYRGHDERLNRDVAIKILRQDHALDANYAQRFEREARAAASISQGNVVDVYDFGEQDGFLYIVMQFVDGEDLKQYIARHGALDPTRARQLTTQILAGLAAIHAAGIIHRDIKPQNVLIGRDGIARVTDFGVAQAAIDVGLTTAGTTVGTAAYMAPEQAQAGTLDESTDIYAVGVVLYEMLTGQMPFTAPTPVAMMLAHIQQDPIPPSRVAPEQRIPTDLDAIVLQAMAKNPADRFRSASAMSRALAGLSTADGTTTVLAAAAAGPAGVQTTRAHAASRRDPTQDVWPAAPDVAMGGQAAAIQPRRAGSGLRGAVGGLLLLLLLATAAGAAFAANQIFGGDNDTTNDRTPTVAAGLATLAPTSEAADVPVVVATNPPTQPAVATDPATGVATGVSTQTPTSAPTQSPTEVPTQVPAVVPTATATAVPTAAPTDVPTATATDVPTAVPTAVPPTEQPTIAPAGNSSGVMPARTGQDGLGSNVANNANDVNAANNASGQSAPNLGRAQTAENPEQTTTDPNPWQGDGVEAASDGDWMVVGPGEEATAVFNVDGASSGGTFKVSIDLAAVDTQQVPLKILVNGTERLRIDDPLPTISARGGDQTLGTLVLRIPSAVFQDGRNEITLVNEANTGRNDWARTDEDDDDDDEDDDRKEGKDKKTDKNTALAAETDGLEPNSIVLGEIVVTLEP